MGKKSFQSFSESKVWKEEEKEILNMLTPYWVIQLVLLNNTQYCMDRIKWEISSELDLPKPELLLAWPYYWCNLERKFLCIDSCDGAIIPLRALQQELLTQGSMEEFRDHSSPFNNPDGFEHFLSFSDSVYVHMFENNQLYWDKIHSKIQSFSIQILLSLTNTCSHVTTTITKLENIYISPKSAL